MLINSEPPFGRKAKELALTVDNFHVTVLTHTSYIDTTKLHIFEPDGRVADALKDQKCQHGFIAPSLRKNIIAAAKAHNVLSPDHLAAILEGES